MNHPSIPVTEDELHALIDGELPDERRADVEAWLASHPEDAARVRAWRANDEALRARYAAVADEPVPARLDLDRLGRTPRRWIAGALAATLASFAIGGGLGWTARGVAAPSQARAHLLTAEALDAHRLYVVEVRHPVEVEGAERAHLQQWLTKRLGFVVRAPELDSAGLKLVGGRLLPGPEAPAGFLMYENARGERFTLYASRSDTAAAQMRYAAQGKDAALSWADRGVGYVLTGPDDRDRLDQVARLVYEQTDRAGG